MFCEKVWYCMNALTAEWVAKAEGDFDSARREVRARVRPNHDSACFHAQQCVEKYPKAVLQEGGVAFTKTHDLEGLLDLCLAIYPLWQAMRPQLQVLTAYAVAFRYPGASADRQDARDALKATRDLRAQFRSALGIP